MAAIDTPPTTKPRRHRRRAADLVSKAEAARMLGCDPATITRRVQAGDLRVEPTGVGERLTIRSLFPGRSDAAVEQLINGIVVLLTLGSLGMGSAAEKMGAMGAAEPGDQFLADSGCQLVDSQLHLLCKLLIINYLTMSIVTIQGPQQPDCPAQLTGEGGVGSATAGRKCLSIPHHKIISHWPRAGVRVGLSGDGRHRAPSLTGHQQTPAPC